MSYKIILAAAVILCTSCQEGKPPTDTVANKPTTPAIASWQPPAAGTLIDEYVKKVDEDKLNNKTFKVSLHSTEQSKEGVYLMKFNYGFNAHEKELSFPKWQGDIVLKPVLKAGTDKYHCLVGFEAGDNTFHEFYEVTVTNGDLAIKQTTGYYPEKK